MCPDSTVGNHPTTPVSAGFRLDRFIADGRYVFRKILFIRRGPNEMPAYPAQFSRYSGFRTFPKFENDYDRRVFEQRLKAPVLRSVLSIPNNWPKQKTKKRVVGHEIYALRFRISR